MSDGIQTLTLQGIDQILLLEHNDLFPKNFVAVVEEARAMGSVSITQSAEGTNEHFLIAFENDPETVHALSIADLKIIFDKREMPKP